MTDQNLMTWVQGEFLKRGQRAGIHSHRKIQL
jgi:hypothetical protein